MSPVSRSLRILAVGYALLAVLTAGCSKKHGAPFDPDAGHPADFFAKHGAAFDSDAGSCAECHGTDLLGGISQVSCFSASRGDQRCHAGGPAGHPAGWADAANHGATAKAAPGPGSGFADCEVCHGADFNGGTVEKSCFGCHQVNAPHPRAPWRGTLTHTTTSPANAAVCAQCHKRGPGTPGCFNNTLCHGQPSGHPDGWDSPAQHGTAAKGAPGSMSGMASCESCHGSGFSGDAGPSCFPCHGWNAPHGKTGWEGGGTSHRTTDEGNAVVCADCHRSQGGTPGCFNNTLCHGSGGGHPDGWAAGNQHGATAKAAPSGSAGFLFCEGCHGSGLNGGSANQSCLINSGCHGWRAPHAKNGWDGGGSSHRTTNQGNAPVCAQCHQSQAGTPGCFNGSLCHGD